MKVSELLVQLQAFGTPDAEVVLDVGDRARPLKEVILDTDVFVADVKGYRCVDFAVVLLPKS